MRWTAGFSGQQRRAVAQRGFQGQTIKNNHGLTITAPYIPTVCFEGLEFPSRRSPRTHSIANKLRLWLKPDGSGNRLVLQVNASGISFEAYPSLAGTTAGWLDIPFSEFKPAPWDTSNAGKTMNAENQKDIRSFGIYINKADGGQVSEGALYLDEIKAQP